MSTWVFGAERWDNLIYYALGGHKDAIVACFFESNSLDVCPCPQTPSPTVLGHVPVDVGAPSPAVLPGQLGSHGWLLAARWVISLVRGEASWNR